MTPRFYFADPWNRFDFLIVVVGLVELLSPGREVQVDPGSTLGWTQIDPTLTTD
jgi:hypothetical protein